MQTVLLPKMTMDEYHKYAIMLLEDSISTILTEHNESLVKSAVYKSFLQLAYDQANGN